MTERIRPGDIVGEPRQRHEGRLHNRKGGHQRCGRKLALKAGYILATTGRDRAITRGYERRIRVGNDKVWLFDGADEADKVYVEAVQPTTDSPVSS